MNQETQNTPQTTDDMGSLGTITHAIYAIQAISLLTAIPMFVGVILNYIKLSDTQGTWLASHFRYQIRTFWFALLWGIIGGVTSVVLIGWFILLLNWFWVGYRVVKGWMRLSRGQMMYV